MYLLGGIPDDELGGKKPGPSYSRTSLSLENNLDGQLTYLL